MSDETPLVTSRPDTARRLVVVCVLLSLFLAAMDSTVIGTNVYVGAGAKVERSVIFDNVTIGRGAIVRNAILDKNVIVPDGFTIGVDVEEDRRRGFTVSDNGVVALAKDQIVIP